MQRAVFEKQRGWWLERAAFSKIISPKRGTIRFSKIVSIRCPVAATIDGGANIALHGSIGAYPAGSYKMRAPAVVEIIYVNVLYIIIYRFERIIKRLFLQTIQYIYIYNLDAYVTPRLFRV